MEHAYRTKPLLTYIEYSEEEMLKRSREIFKDNSRRRTVREFSDRPVPRGVIENCIRAAGTAPSGANQQPWHFVVVSNAEVKRKIRLAAEEEEREFYGGKASEEWLHALEPLGTGDYKPFLEEAPYLIVIFASVHHLDETGNKVKHYYPYESTGIATGMLISAVHRCGLVSLTHTPSPMKFLTSILKRPKYERPYLILPVGYPKEDVEVPDIYRKPLAEICTFV